MNWYMSAFKKFADFSGRARRKEYWYFFLFNILISMALGFLDAASGNFNDGAMFGLFGGIYALAAFIPGLSLSVRRLHDTGHSGWWFLICLLPFIGVFVFLYFMIKDSDPGMNAFGGNPKEIAGWTGQEE